MPVSEADASAWRNTTRLRSDARLWATKSWKKANSSLLCDVEGSLSGKKVALFGSYGWGDGQWMRDWQDRVSGDGAQLFEEGLMANGAPDEAECEAFGKRFSAF